MLKLRTDNDMVVFIVYQFYFVLSSVETPHFCGSEKYMQLLAECFVVPLLPNLLQQPSRHLTYYSLRKGKRKSVKAVVKRFLRLHCGLWLRRKAGYKKKLWKKKPAHKRRLNARVFCNKTQSKLLDKMTTSFWKRRNWFANDPYLKYHDRPQLKAGYKKKLWKKKPAHKRRLQQHVFCNKTQSKLLDKMTTSFWKRRNWFANDPYLKYHDRPQLKV
ncbi:RM35 protein, partial [Polypterus senegalus]|nr:RM35 protein [Polypterus senegalus]